MGKHDIATRIQRGIQPGLAPILPNMGMKPNKSSGGETNNLLSPSFDDVMNKKPDMANSVDKHAIGPRPSIMNKLNNKY